MFEFCLSISAALSIQSFHLQNNHAQCLWTERSLEYPVESPRLVGSSTRFSGRDNRVGAGDESGNGNPRGVGGHRARALQPIYQVCIVLRQVFDLDIIPNSIDAGDAQFRPDEEGSLAGKVREI